MVKTLIILNGSGSHGLWQWVCWRALQAHVDADAVVGQGIGALNGWLIATGQGDLGDRFWSGVDASKFYAARWPVITAARWALSKVGMAHRVQALQKGRPLRKTIQGLVRSSSWEYIIPLHCIKTSLNNGSSSYQHGPGDMVWRDLYASAATPGLYEPIYFAGQQWISGLARFHRPIAWGVKTYGASLERVIMISCDTEKPLHRPQAGHDVEHVVEKSTRWMMADLARADVIMARKCWPALDIRLISPPEDLGSSQSFDPALMHNRASLAATYIRSYIAEHLE